jgi:AbrB family looped-hinge helix DNA binding protein
LCVHYLAEWHQSLSRSSVRFLSRPVFILLRVPSVFDCETAEQFGLIAGQTLPGRSLPLLARRGDSTYLTFVLPRMNPMAADKLTTTVSTKGQVILPKAIREERRWRAGTRLTIESTPDGVLLKPSSPFPAAKPADVFASLPHRGKPRSVEEMEAGIAAEARRRHARD